MWKWLLKAKQINPADIIAQDTGNWLIETLKIIGKGLL
jgi:hypothetical protein